MPLKKELETWPLPFSKEYIKHQEEITLDNINLLYVAMTRPKERLYIISNYDTKRGNIYRHFLDFLTTKKMSEFKNHTFKTGKKLKAQSQKTSVENITSSTLISEDWRSRIRIRKKHTFNQNLKQKYSIVWGELIHDIMAGVNTATDIDIILRELNIEKKYNQTVFNKIKKNIIRIIRNPTISHLFQKDVKVFSETSILSENGKILPSRITNVSQKKQRELSLSIKRARNLALM